MTPFLHQWAIKHGVSLAAVEELKTLMGVGFVPVDVSTTAPKKSEAYQTSLVRLQAPFHGIWLTRNNVGALMDKTGRPVRYGLANETKQQNEKFKSGDLIGIHTFTVEQHHVGMQIGQFCSIEMKEQGWQYTGDEHEQGQLNFANFVVSKGGAAIFASEPHHLFNIAGVKPK